jgi:hypothetical protein
MKKFVSILILLFAPIFIFGQNQNYQGFYQTQFFNVFGNVKVIRADFEVRDDNTITGKIESGGTTKIIQGQVTSKGKFEARTLPENNVVTIIRGEFPRGGKDGKVSLIERTEQKGNGSKSVSENGISGFIKQVSPPAELKDVGIADNGKTLLWFQHSDPLFGKEWADAPSSAKISNIVGRAAEIEIRSDVTNPARRFKFRINFRQPDQKIWAGSTIPLVSYTERKMDNAGKLEQINLFTGGNDDAMSGQVELISETENEMVFKITNLKFKKVGAESFVQVDGYIHAVKNKN